jgi:predicted dehydrogenase
LALKAIYSRSLKSAKALGESAGNVDLYSDDSGSGKTYNDLLQRSDILAVIIALPIPSQPKYIEAALAAGKHVLSEKPIAGDIEEAQKLIKYYNTKINRNNVFWGVAENFRFLDSFLYGQQEIQKLGKVLGFRVKMFTKIKPGNKGYGNLTLKIVRGRPETLLTSAV